MLSRIEWKNIGQNRMNSWSTEIVFEFLIHFQQLLITFKESSPLVFNLKFLGYKRFRIALWKFIWHKIWEDWETEHEIFSLKQQITPSAIFHKDLFCMSWHIMREASFNIYVNSSARFEDNAMWRNFHLLYAMKLI